MGNGVNMVLVVAMPSLSGISDVERILKTAETLRTKTAVCINKADVNSAKAVEIQTFSRANSIPFTGAIPFGPEAVQAVNRGKSIAEVDYPSGRAVRRVFQNTMAQLFQGGNPS